MIASQMLISDVTAFDDFYSSYLNIGIMYKMNNFAYH